MDLINQPIGSEGNLNIRLEGGKIILEAKHNHASGSASVVISEDVKYFAEKLKKAIPGTLDDLLIDVAVGQLP